MQAKALICDEQQTFSIQDVILKDLAPAEVLVRNVYSGVSIGTEFALIRNNISWGPFPICTGYMATGVVEVVGSEVSNFKVGDVVYYRGNSPMKLADGTEVSAVSGTHCSHAVFNPNTTHGAAILPANTPVDVASMFVMPAVGLFGVDMSNPRMGDVVVVHGAGLIGLGVIAACAHRGCKVVAVDINPKALSLAQTMGADMVINAAEQTVELVLKHVAPQGADVVFESTGIPSLVNDAIRLCKPFGKFVWQGNYGAAPVPLNFLSPHGKRLQMFFPCDDGLQPCRRAVVKNMAMGTLRWDRTISHRIDYPEAPDMYETINTTKHEDIFGVVIKWSDLGAI